MKLTARQWLFSGSLSVIWVALTCWLGMVHYIVSLACISLGIISAILGFILYLGLYGALGYMTAKCMHTWKQCVLLFLFQAVLVFGTAWGSWFMDTVHLFRPFALFYVKDPVSTLLHKNAFDSFVMQYCFAWVEMIVLQILSITASKIALHRSQTFANKL